MGAEGREADPRPAGSVILGGRWRLHELDRRAVRTNSVDHPRSSPRTARDRLRRALRLPAVGGDPHQKRVDVIDHQGQMREAWVERLGWHAWSVRTSILQEFDRLIRQRNDRQAHRRPMRSGDLTEELALHLARPHEACAEPIDPEPKCLVEGADREADMIGALHVDARAFRHAGRSTGKGAARLQWVVCSPSHGQADWVLTLVLTHCLLA
jgi:hypothetical protein